MKISLERNGKGSSPLLYKLTCGVYELPVYREDGKYRVYLSNGVIVETPHLKSIYEHRRHIMVEEIEYLEYQNF